MNRQAVQIGIWISSQMNVASRGSAGRRAHARGLKIASSFRIDLDMTFSSEVAARLRRQIHGKLQRVTFGVDHECVIRSRRSDGGDGPTCIRDAILDNSNAPIGRRSLAVLASVPTASRPAGSWKVLSTGYLSTCPPLRWDFATSPIQIDVYSSCENAGLFTFAHIQCLGRAPTCSDLHPLDLSKHLSFDMDCNVYRGLTIQQQRRSQMIWDRYIDQNKLQSLLAQRYSPGSYSMMVIKPFLSH